MIYGRFMSDLVATFPLEKGYWVSTKYNFQNQGRQIRGRGGGSGGASSLRSFYTSNLVLFSLS